MAARKQSKNWVWPSLILGCILLALAPAPVSQVFEPVRHLFSLILYPITSPLYLVSSQVRARMFSEPGQHQGNLKLYQDQIKTQNNLILQLKQQNAALKQQQIQMGVIREALDDPTVKMLPARIIGRGRGAAQYYYELNQGSNQGMKIGMPVLGGSNLDGPYLIGRVIKVGPRTAVFETLNRPGQELNAYLSSPQGTASTASKQLTSTSRPILAQDNGLWITKVSNAEGVKVGDQVRLKDQGVYEWGSWLPAVQGWLIGEVVEIRNISDDHLRKHIIIQPVMTHFGAQVTVVVAQEQLIQPSMPAFTPEARP